MGNQIKNGMLVVVLLSLVACLVFLQQHIKRLSTEVVALREQLSDAILARDIQQRTTAELRAKIESLQADRGELMRLRAQSSRMRQFEEENAQLHRERQRLLAAAAKTQTDAALSTGQESITPPDIGTNGLSGKILDFGVIEISDQAPIRLEFGDGRECLVTTHILGDGNLQLVLSSESLIDGVPIQTKQTLNVAAGGERMATKVNGVDISLIPVLKNQSN